MKARPDIFSVVAGSTTSSDADLGKEKADSFFNLSGMSSAETAKRLDEQESTGDRVSESKGGRKLLGEWRLRRKWGEDFSKK